jgi:hypothetical protein
MRSLILSLALAGLSAGAAHAQSPQTPNAFAGEAFADADVLALEMLDYEPAVRDPLSALDMLEADGIGPSGEDLGDVEDILVTLDGYAVSLVVELDEFLEFNETTVSIPIATLDLLPGAGEVRSPVAADGLEMFSAFDRSRLTADVVANRVVGLAEDDVDDVVTGSDVFLLDDELLGEYAPLDGDAQGYVHDVLFSMEGRIDTVVISAERIPGGDVAVPFTGSSIDGGEPSVLEMAPFTAEEMGVRE